MILFLHHRYRVRGGEDRAVDALADVVRRDLGEEVEVLERDSTTTSSGRAVAGLLAGGVAPDEVAAAVRRTGARIVHAHNVSPTYGWRALAAAREAGAKVVLHLHNYRLVCAQGSCVDPQGARCTRCHGRDTTPGLRLNCRGARAEGLAYAASIAAWQRRLVGSADALVAPSARVRDILDELGAPLDGRQIQVVPNVVRDYAPASSAAVGTYALVAARLAPEKGVGVAIDACRTAGLPLVVAGDGPLAQQLRAQARGADVRFTGRVEADALAALRARAAVALVPTLEGETFGLAALEAMAAGVPVVASDGGALRDLEGGATLVTPGDVDGFAAAATAAWQDAAAGDHAIGVARAIASPDVVADALRAVYDGL